jgi:Flp pilus assembly protein TadG
MAALKRARSRWTDASGAELIEFALVFPLLLFVVLGIIDFGFLFQRFEVVTNAAREGARVAVLPGYSDADVQTRVNQYLTAGGLTGPSTTSVGAPQLLPVGGLCVTLRPVTVAYPYTYSFIGGIAGYFGGSFTNKTLRATVAMRNELPAGSCP